MENFKGTNKGRRQMIRDFRCFFSILICITVMSIVLLLPQYIKDEIPISILQSYHAKRINRNYFLDAKSLNDTTFLVNTSGCKIPDIPVWDSTILHLVTKAEPSEKCWETHWHWTYVEDEAIIINGSDISVQGYTLNSIECCYRIITRKEQDTNKYDRTADDLVSYSQCFPMNNVTRPASGEYFMVTCNENTWTGKLTTLYTQYHAIPKSLETNKEKSLYWNKYLENDKNEIPPNIIFVGLDSTSRLNVQRNMFKTVAALKELGAIEMLGYTKGGTNTFPNICIIFNGYSEDELKNICFSNDYEKQDNCPFIWKRFDKANYFTAHIEDRPDLAIFNYRKTGFVHQPVDFYPRTLFVAAHENSPDILNRLHLVKNNYLDCIGYKTNDEMIVEYILNLMNMTEKQKVPLFSLSWSTTLTHDIVNNCQLIDDIYASLVHTVRKTTDNTIFIFLSDHGYRFGAYRETLSGWYESKLPALWIFLPEKIKKRFPHWQNSLIANSKRLSSPYHLHWMINQILDEFTNTSTLPDEKDRNTGKLIPKKFKFSLFDQLSENWNCEDVGVPETYCACYPLQKVESEDTNLQNAATKAIQFVNDFLPDNQCATLIVNVIVGGAMIDKTSHKSNKRITYIVSFTSEPGDFLFEADIDYFPWNKTFSQPSNVLRTNKINTDVSCVRNSRILEQYCYCKDQ